MTITALLLVRAPSRQLDEARERRSVPAARCSDRMNASLRAEAKWIISPVD
jgi:hypothetical protein